ncbi:hypothetical protein BD410DRAFT_842218 [Rickenella mellea]|uniref:Uncharacterized protein n=1 Tax=Rickenella mellea TaxID=50990 RepID=A0A4Y7PW06_9AGAM|nr:hypothetical protein BD410DRAFT_842218 [Rickenella mellea]
MANASPDGASTPFEIMGNISSDHTAAECSFLPDNALCKDNAVLCPNANCDSPAEPLPSFPEGTLDTPSTGTIIAGRVQKNRKSQSAREKSKQKLEVLRKRSTIAIVGDESKSNISRTNRRKKRKHANQRSPDDATISAILERAEVHQTAADLTDTPHSKPGWQGIKESSHQGKPICSALPERERHTHRLHAECNGLVRRLVTKEGYRYVTNDPTRAQLLLDSQGRVIFAKAKPPSDRHGHFSKTTAGFDDASWDFDADIDNLGAQRRKKGKKRKVSGVKSNSFGVSMGGGQLHPKELDPLNKAHAEAIKRFASNPHVQSVMRHVEVTFNTFFPKLANTYQYMKDQALKIYGLVHDYFAFSSFSATAVNSGGDVATSWHRDFLNLVFGVCAVFVTGDFDHRISGHVIMKEFRTIVEIRPGDLYFEPSGSVTHRNAPIRKEETRNSCVLFSAAGLFRWQHQGFKKQEKKNGPKGEAGRSRWEEGINLFSTIEELSNRLKLDLTRGRALLDQVV